MTVSVRLDEATVKGLKLLAAADDRKLSPYVARLLKRHVEAAEASGEIPNPSARAGKPEKGTRKR